MEAPDNLKWQWPDELDALLAAPNHHKLLFENDHVRVIDALIPTEKPLKYIRTAGLHLYMLSAGQRLYAMMEMEMKYLIHEI